MAQTKVLLGHVKGDDGPAGPSGKDAKIESATVTVTPGHLDEPTCTVDVGGEAGAQTLTFNFTGIQGEKGDKGSGAGEVEWTGTSDQVVLGDGTNKNISELGPVASATSATSADSATTATKLTTETAGDTTHAVYFNEGIPVQVDKVAEAASADTATSATSADTATSAEKLTTTSAGDETHAVYFNEGIPVQVEKVAAATTADSATSATTAETANKLGSETVGSANQPIYLEEGVPKAATVQVTYSGTSSQLLLGDGTTLDISTFITNNIEAIRTALGVATTEKNGLLPMLPAEPEA